MIDGYSRSRSEASSMISIFGSFNSRPTVHNPIGLKQRADAIQSPVRLPIWPRRLQSRRPGRQLLLLGRRAWVAVLGPAVAGVRKVWACG